MKATAQQQMLAAAGEIEATAQQLAAAVDRYMAAYQTVSRATYPDVNRQYMLDGVVGTALFPLLVQRLRALGLDPMLKVARAGGTLDETWVQDLEERIRRFA